MNALRWFTTMGTARSWFGRTWTLGTHNGARPGSTEVPQIQFIDFVVVEAFFSSSTEPGTHSLKLCIMDWIDMPVVVHVKVVDISGVAQTHFPWSVFSRDSTVTVH